MNKAGKILSVNPPNAIPGGEVVINCENFAINAGSEFGCYFAGKAARIIGASTNRILAIIPDKFDSTDVEVYLENDGERSDAITFTIGKKLADGLHLVANPAVDPKDDSIILTRSGSRGQSVSPSLFRLEPDGYLSEMPVEILNPTAPAFDKSGQLFVTARADGEVCRINRDEEVIPYASDLGIATGLVFNDEGVMYVGDRGGTIYRVTSFGNAESFAILEPSVSAYHMAFGTDGHLYVSAPGLWSYDAIFRIDKEGFEEIFYRGLGRPQGLAFDRDGNLYVAGCLQGRHGIVKITSKGEAEIFAAGMNVVGLCFTKKGDLIVATNDSVYSLPLGIQGVLL